MADPKLTTTELLLDAPAVFKLVQDAVAKVQSAKSDGVVTGLEALEIYASLQAQFIDIVRTVLNQAAD